MEVFTIDYAPRHYECCRYSTSTSDESEPIGIAFVQEAPPPSDPIRVNECDRILTGSDTFESRSYSGSKIQHRNCYHVKVEGSYAYRGDDDREPCVHGTVSNLRYIRSDWSGDFRYSHDYSENRKEDIYYRIARTSQDLCLRQRFVIRRPRRGVGTVSISFQLFAHGSMQDSRGGYYVTTDDLKFKEAWDMEFEDDALPSLVDDIWGEPLDYDQVVTKWYAWENGAKWCHPTENYDEWSRTGSSPFDPNKMISNIHRLTDFIFDQGRRIDTDWQYWRDVAANDALSHSYCNDGNAYEFWKDVPKFGIETKDLTGILVDGVQSVKQVSKAYLSTHYGSQLTLSDAQKWCDAVAKYAWRNKSDHYARIRSAREYPVSKPDYRLKNGTSTLVYSLYYDPEWDRQTLKQLTDEMGLNPSAQHIWELVPFSFVADWFHNFSADLEAIRSGRRLIDLHIWGEEISTKYSFELADYPGLTLTYYQRTGGNFATADPQASPEQYESQWSSHWLEGAALILSH